MQAIREHAAQDGYVAHPMTHSICTSDADGMSSYLQRLGRTLFAPNIDPRTRLEQLFEHETDEFDLNYAFLASIDLENRTEHFEVVHGSHEVLKPGTTVLLSKTYCRKTIADPEGTVAVNDAPAEGWEDDPAYDTFKLGSYLGTTVSVADELYGTLCFADTAARDEPLIPKEKALVEMYGQWVGYILTLWGEPPVRETRIDTIQGRTVSSEAIDSMMDALTSRTRRVILMTLLEDSPDISIAVLKRRLNHEEDRMMLYHSHLPKLANFGYIKWNNDENTVSRGPKFSEVGPLLQLLQEYETEFPE